MTDPLVCLIYASRPEPAPTVPLDQMVRDILIASMNNNRLAAISGLLVTHDDWFLQALEGPQSAVEQTFQRIARDRRHRDATRRLVRRTQARLFPRWTMCAQSLSDADSTILRRLAPRGGLDPFTCPSEAAQELLTTVADLHGQLLSDQYAELQGEILTPG